MADDSSQEETLVLYDPDEYEFGEFPDGLIQSMANTPDAYALRMNAVVALRHKYETEKELKLITLSIGCIPDDF